jgi:hypothetical protein
VHTPDPSLPEPQPAGTPAPLCIDCKHHAQRPPRVMSESTHRCTHPALRSPVDGSDACCVSARARKSRCGQAGALFVKHVG